MLPQDVRDSYELGDVLGEGQFGLVRKAAHRGTRKLFACKSISKTQLRFLEEIEDVRREVQIMQHLAGLPHIVRVRALTAHTDLIGLASEHILLIVHYCLLSKSNRGVMAALSTLTCGMVPGSCIQPSRPIWRDVYALLHPSSQSEVMGPMSPRWPLVFGLSWPRASGDVTQRSVPAGQHLKTLPGCCPRAPAFGPLLLILPASPRDAC